MKKLKLIVILVVVFALAVALLGALAWQEGPGTDWWYIDANYEGWKDGGAPPVIELNGNPASGQTFNVGDTVNITVDLHAYAASCGGDGNGAYTEWLLEVTGPSGPDSDSGWNYDHSSSCAEVEVDTTLTIAYTLTAPGTHTVYMNSYASVSQYWTDVAEESADALLTFEVAVPVPNKADVLIDSGVPGKGLESAPGLQKPFNPKSQAEEHAGKK